MGWLIKFVLGKASGPVLVYALLAFITLNVAQGFLLKRAWDNVAQAALECENQALRDANVAKEAVTAELLKIQDELIQSKKQRQIAGEQAEREITARLYEKEIEHAQAIADMEIATNEITDDEFWCASEPVPLPIMRSMRDAATAYNQTRNNPSTGIPPD